MGCKRGSVLNPCAQIHCAYLPSQISKVYTHYACTLLFFFFGLKSLYDALFKASDVSQRGSTLGQQKQSFLLQVLQPTMLAASTLPGGELH